MAPPRVLILGASRYQVDVIHAVRALGCETLVADNVPKNPGHLIADRSFNVSTDDVQAITKLATSEQIDGIAVYASDLALITAAQVCETLSLPGPASSLVEICCDKLAFRQWQKRHNFPHPLFLDASDPLPEASPFPGKFLRKPLRDSGGKEIRLFHQWPPHPIPCQAAGSFLFEEQIPGEHRTFEGLVSEGRILWAALTQRRTVSEEHPTTRGHELFHEEGGEIFLKVVASMEAILRKLNYREGVLDVDLVLRDGVPVVLEMAPRGGGNHLARLIRFCTDVDLPGCVARFALGLPVSEPCPSSPPRNGFLELVGTDSPGTLRFEQAQIPSALRATGLEEAEFFFPPGRKVPCFHDSQGQLGYLLGETSPTLPVSESRSTFLRRVDFHIEEAPKNQHDESAARE